MTPGKYEGFVTSVTQQVDSSWVMLPMIAIP